MERWLLIALAAVAVLALLAVASGQAGLLAGHAPADLGVQGGRLKAPSKTPNSVSSQADLWPGHPQQAQARIAPLALVGSGAETLARLRRLVEATPGARIVTARDDYLHATFSTPLMKYTDDAEFWLDPAAGVVQVRSASRLGRSDLGANRARIEALRSRLAVP
ncbi:MAG: DUF1499 domain-containing protein [Leptothrix sp. (in: Bacteria)]|nr:DUF1499 domain-containing protein [Leptothrix sp. (in: b-proteobacteria)]